MITEKSFIVPIYDFRVNAVVFDDLKEVGKKYPEFMTGGTKACTVEYIGKSEATIIVPTYRYASMVHELEHLKNIIWKAKDYRPQVDNDEVDAYLIEELYVRIDKIIRKHLATQC